MMDSLKPNSKAFDEYINYQVRFAIEARQGASEAYVASERWLSASLFALNGGAIVSLLQIEDFSRHTLKDASLAYLLGIILCFGMVIIGQHTTQKQGRFLNDRGNRLIQLLDPSVPLEDLKELEEPQIRALRRMDLLAQVIGALSLTAFLIGCGIASRAI